MVSLNEDFESDRPKSLEVELTDKASEGQYSNLVLVSHSPTEFILDFARLLPGPPKAKVHSRIIMAPQHVKSLIATLQENLGKYERNFGRVPPPPNQNLPGGEEIV